MNKIILIGRLTKDVEVKIISTGKKNASFSLAVEDGRDKSGTKLTQFFNCTAWGKTAEVLELYARKGTQLMVVGRLQNRSWDKPDGTKGYATDITVNEIELLGGRQEQTISPAKVGSEETLPEIDMDGMNVQFPF